MKREDFETVEGFEEILDILKEIHKKGCGGCRIGNEDNNGRMFTIEDCMSCPLSPNNDYNNNRNCQSSQEKCKNKLNEFRVMFGYDKRFAPKQPTKELVRTAKIIADDDCVGEKISLPISCRDCPLNRTQNCGDSKEKAKKYVKMFKYLDI